MRDPASRVSTNYFHMAVLIGGGNLTKLKERQKTFKKIVQYNTINTDPSPKVSLKKISFHFLPQRSSKYC